MGDFIHSSVLGVNTEMKHTVLDYESPVPHRWGMSDGQEIKKRREARDWSQQELAKKAGTNQQTVARIELGRTVLSRALPKIKKILDMDTGISSVPLPDSLPDGARDLPIFASAQGGPGDMLLTHEPIDYVQRPEPLATVRNGYGMYIVGDSMAPAFEQGDLALVNPHVPYQGNDDVLIFKEYNEEYAAVVKRLVRATADSWHLRQFNPDKIITLSRKEWPKCHVIVGKYKRR